jgi:HEAT repeat protein
LVGVLASRSLAAWWRERGRAIRVLAALLLLAFCAGGCRSVGDTVEDLASEDYEDRYEAAIDLTDGIQGHEPDHVAARDDIARGLRALLDDRSALVRQIAISCLVEVEGRAAAAAIADRLRDKDPWVQYVAASALGEVHASGHVEDLVQALARGENEDIRRAAAKSLKALRAEAALRDLFFALAGDDSPSVRYHSYVALRSITGKDPGEDPRAWRPLVGQ